jgi:protein-tyrosine-phosphatase
MAEAIARHFLADRIEASSAGLAPLGYIPDLTIEVLKEADISTEGLYSKSLFSMPLSELDYLVNLTDIKVELLIPRSFSGDLISSPVRDPFGQGIKSFRATREKLEKIIRRKLSFP